MYSPTPSNGLVTSLSARPTAIAARRSRSTPAGGLRTACPTSGGQTSTTATSASAGTTKSTSSWQVVSMSSVVPMATDAVSSSERWFRARSSSRCWWYAALISRAIPTSPLTSPSSSRRW